MRFYILNGVRRAVASLASGRKTIRAILYREGMRPKLYRRMRLDRLFSGKPSVLRDLRFLRIVPPIHEPMPIRLTPHKES
jgi:hypothetical protein